MSRRARAAAFALAALGCALIAAALANGYRDRVANQYGALRQVVVAARALPAGKVLAPADLKQATAIRRVPARFVPAGVIGRPADALGRAPAAAVPVGAYLLDQQLQVPAPPQPQGPKLGGGLRPVQINVTGAEALTVEGASPQGELVDVVVSNQSQSGGRGRTYIAAAGVKLLALGGSGPEAGPEGGAGATLALTEAQALDLISAETAARQIRLLPRP